MEDHHENGRDGTGMMKFKLYSFFIFAGISSMSNSSAQTVPPNQSLISLQHFVTKVKPATFDSSFTDLHYVIGENLNYLYPVYQLLGDNKKFIHEFSSPVYYDLLSQSVSFVGDYSAALEYQKLSDTTHLTDVDYRQIGKSIQQLKKIKNADAKKFISFIAPNYKVIMLNEANNKPLHRAFAYSLLDVLYNRGFRYLAMEMLNPMPDQELTKLTYKTGHFATEPVAGELIRQALDLGFRLVAYEDPDGNRHSPTERDSIQALNIARILKQSSPLGRELDSLADVVSFGVAPGLIIYQFLRMSFMRQQDGADISMIWLLPALILPCAAAYRLAVFNLDTTQGKSFKGIPVPAVGLMIASFPLIYWTRNSSSVMELLINKWVLYAVVALLSFGMVSRIPMLSLKAGGKQDPQTLPRLILIVLALAAVILLQWLAVPLIFLFYIVLSLAFKNRIA